MIKTDATTHFKLATKIRKKTTPHLLKACLYFSLLLTPIAFAQISDKTASGSISIGTTYRNPILPGDFADPSILRDGENYYMTHSSFDLYPGLLIWHSKDLINWKPTTRALNSYVGSVWAPDLIKYEDTFYRGP